MANTITFDAFSLSDDNYITSSVEYRTIPARQIDLEPIARKPGKKYLANEFGERRIKLSGWIVGSDNANLISLIDSLHTNVTRKKIGTLAIDPNRDIQAIVSVVTIPEPHYTQSAVPFDLEFIAAEPFFQGTQISAVTDVAEGTGTITISTTISGSVFAEPTVTYAPRGGLTDTLINKIVLSYDATGELTTWSGGDHTLNRAKSVAFDFANQIITEGTTEVVAAGVFPRFEPGATSLTIYYYSTSTSSTTTSTSSTTTSSSTTMTGTSTSTTRSTSTSTSTTLANPTLTITYKPRYL